MALSQTVDLPIVSKVGCLKQIKTLFTMNTLDMLGLGNWPLKKRDGNWAEITLPTTSGTVTSGREKNWLIADQCVFISNDPRNNCGTHFDPSSFVVSEVANMNMARNAGLLCTC